MRATGNIKYKNSSHIDVQSILGNKFHLNPRDPFESYLFYDDSSKSNQLKINFDSLNKLKDTIIIEMVWYEVNIDLGFHQITMFKNGKKIKDIVEAIRMSANDILHNQLDVGFFVTDIPNLKWSQKMITLKQLKKIFDLDTIKHFVKYDKIHNPYGLPAYRYNDIIATNNLCKKFKSDDVNLRYHI